MRLQFMGQVLLRHLGVIHLRKGRFQDAWRDCIQMSRGRLHGRLRLEPAHYRQPPPISLVEGVAFGLEAGLGTDRDSDTEAPSYFHAKEIRRRHADDGNWMTIQQQCFTNCVWAAPEFPLPERITDHRARSTATRHVVLNGKQPPQIRFDAKYVEVITTDPKTVCIAAFAAGSEIEALIAPGENTGECLLTVANLLPQRIGHSGVAPGKAA